MQFTLLEKIGATLLLVLTLVGAEQVHERHIYNKGVAAEKSRRDAIDAKIKATADRELARLAALLTAARAELAQAKNDLEQKRKDYEDANTENSALRADLAVGRRRLLVAVRAGRCQAAHADGAGPGQVDNGASVTAELDPAVAAGLAGLTGTGDSAIRRLNGCIVAYDALKNAVNTAGDHTTEQEK